MSCQASALSPSAHTQNNSERAGPTIAAGSGRLSDHRAMHISKLQSTLQEKLRPLLWSSRRRSAHQPSGGRFVRAIAAYLLNLGELPLLVAERADVPGLEPALDAVQMKDVTTCTCGIGG